MSTVSKCRSNSHYTTAFTLFHSHFTSYVSRGVARESTLYEAIFVDIAIGFVCSTNIFFFNFTVVYREFVCKTESCIQALIFLFLLFQVC